MARIPQVTRTITTTKASVLCLDLETKQTVTISVTIPRTYKDEAAILKAVKATIETETLKAVHIVDTSVEETLYGMTEAEFIANATPLPARGSHTSNDTSNANIDND